MLDKDVIKKFLQELANDGIIASACRKSGLNRMTFYRLRDKDPAFKKKVKEAMKIGRENGGDLSDFSLLQLIREKNLGAIKWYQIHNDSRYRPKPRRVYLVHSNTNNSEKAITAKKKDDIRTYSAGYTDAMKVFLEEKREEFKRYDTEEAILERVEEVRTGKAEGLDDNLMEEGRQQYAKENGEPIEENISVVEPSLPPQENKNLDDEVVSKIIMDLPDDDDE